MMVGYWDPIKLMWDGVVGYVKCDVEKLVV